MSFPFSARPFPVSRSSGVPAGALPGPAPSRRGGPVPPPPPHCSPAPCGWESRHDWEEALLVKYLPANAGASLTAALPRLLPLTQPWQPPRPQPGRMLLPAWAFVDRQRLTPRELAGPPEVLLRQLRQELRLGLRTLVTPEDIIGRGTRNGLLAALSVRLGQAFAALAQRVGWSVAQRALEQTLASL